MSTNPKGIRFGTGVPIVSGGIIVPPTGDAGDVGGVSSAPATEKPLYTTLVEIQFDTGWEYFSFHGVGAPAKFYEPYLLAIGSLERESPIYGGSFRTSDIDVTLINYNQYFTKKKGSTAPGKFFYNRVLRVLHGFTENGLAAMDVIFTGRISKWSSSESGEFVITARDMIYDRFNALIPSSSTVKILDTTTFPNLPVGTEPRLVPIVYGACDVDPSVDHTVYDLGGPIPCYLIDDSVSGRWRYVVAQHVCKSVSTVFLYGSRIVTDNTVYWEPQITPNNDEFTDIVWANTLGLFVAISGTAINGTGSVVMRSTDGITWLTSASSSSRDWRSIAWAESIGTFVAVGISATTRVMTSANGIAWTDRTAANTKSYNGVCWSPALSLFVAVGSTTGDTANVMTSPDGITWTARTAASVNDWKSVVWSPELAIFVAVSFGTGSGNRVMTSTNGTSWTSRSTPAVFGADNTWNDVAWSPTLSLFAAVASSGAGNRVMTSPDGVTWTSRTSAANVNWQSVIWAPGPSLFVAVANTGTGNRVMISSDGITWTSGSASADSAWTSVAWSPELGIFAAVNTDAVGFRAMTGATASFEAKTVAYGGVNMTVLDFNFDPRESTDVNTLEITASVNGVTDTGLTTGTLLTNPVDCLEHFLLNYAGCTAAELDSELFDNATTAATTAGYTCGMAVLVKDVPFVDIINKWCVSFLGSLYTTRASKFGVYLKTATVPVAPGGFFSDDVELLERTFHVDSNENVAAKVYYDYLQIWPHNFFSGHSNIAVGETVELSSLSTGELVSMWYVRNSATAGLVAAAYADLKREEVEFVSFDLTPDQYSAVDLNTIVSLVHWQGTGLAGYNEAVMRVYQLGVNLTPNDIRIRVHALKLRSGVAEFTRPRLPGRLVRPVIPAAISRPYPEYATG